MSEPVRKSRSYANCRSLTNQTLADFT